jgi:hypothetical protein
MDEQPVPVRIAVDDVPKDQLPEGAILFAEAPLQAQLTMIADDKFKRLPELTQIRLLRHTLLSLAGIFAQFDTVIAGVFEQLYQGGYITKAGEPVRPASGLVGPDGKPVPRTPVPQQ